MTRAPLPGSKRTKARPNPTSVVGNARDLDVLASIAEAGYLSSPQVEKLHFPSRRRTQMRLRDLRDHGLVRAHLPGGALHLPNVYTITPIGLEVLLDHGVLQEAEQRPGRCPTTGKLRHGVAIRDVYVAFELAARDRCFELESFLFEGALQKHPVFQAVGLVPDALAFMNADDGRIAVGIEVDLATETNATVTAKFQAWRTVAAAGAAAFGGRQLQVSVAVPSEGRRRRMAELADLAGLRVDVALLAHVQDNVRARYSHPPIAPPARAERMVTASQAAVFAEARR